MISFTVKNIGSCGWQIMCDTVQIVPQLELDIFDRIGIPNEHRHCFYLMFNGKRLQDYDFINSFQPVYLVPRVLGGKGGFGSMLRAIGAQIEKTTNREACRDLSGRRLRDINEEMRLKKWITKQAEKDQDKLTRSRERLEHRLSTPNHEFMDAEYDKHRSQLAGNINDALNEGLTVVKSVKRSASSEAGPRNTKKPKLWLDPEECPSDENSDAETVCLSLKCESACHNCDAMINQKAIHSEASTVHAPFQPD